MPPPSKPGHPEAAGDGDQKEEAQYRTEASIGSLYPAPRGLELVAPVAQPIQMNAAAGLVYFDGQPYLLFHVIGEHPILPKRFERVEILAGFVHQRGDVVGLGGRRGRVEYDPALAGNKRLHPAMGVRSAHHIEPANRI